MLVITKKTVQSVRRPDWSSTVYVLDDLCRAHLADHRAQLTRPKVKDLHKTRLTSVHCVDERGADMYLCLNFAYMTSEDQGRRVFVFLAKPMTSLRSKM